MSFLPVVNSIYLLKVFCTDFAMSLPFPKNVLRVMPVWEVSDDKTEIKRDRRDNYDLGIHSGYTALCRSSLKLEVVIFKLPMHLGYLRISWATIKKQKQKQKTSMKITTVVFCLFVCSCVCFPKLAFSLLLSTSWRDIEETWLKKIPAKSLKWHFLVCSIIIFLFCFI